jgi:hypothetical protein
MSSVRRAAPGTARTCPHCKATILDSASTCPVCRHHLRFESALAAEGAAATSLRIEGTIRQPATVATGEYSIVLTITDGGGKELARQVIGVGALRPDDQRTVSLSIEVFTPSESGKGQTSH